MPGRREWALWLAAGGLAACSTPRPSAPWVRPLWPAPPELPRYIYETALRNAASLRDDSEAGRMQRLLTSEDAGRASFGKPMAVAARRGRIYVTDTEGRRVFVFDCRGAAPSASAIASKAS